MMHMSQATRENNGTYGRTREEISERFSAVGFEILDTGFLCIG